MKRNFAVTLLMISSLFLITKANAAFWNRINIKESAKIDKSELNPAILNLAYPNEEPVTVEPVVDKAKVVKVANNKGYAILVDNKQTIWFTADLPSMTAEERANIVANTINKVIADGIDPASIRPVREGKYTFLKAGDINLVTVDEFNAKSVGVSVHELAYTWANDTRNALGAKTLKKDYTDVSRGYNGQESRYMGHTMMGVASWYGPTFHGRRAADGSRFNTDEYTAAHKTYPFGTLVKVTNLRTNKSCVVKITDRGPYAHGRIIDLSKKAADDIGMLGSGIAKVKLEVVGQY